MSNELRDRLFGELDALVLIDPHTHIDPLRPAAETLGDLLGYHYYTELAHSAGLARERIEEPGIGPKEKVARLVPSLAALDNTVQVSWMNEILRSLFDCGEETLTPDNWESIFDRTAAMMARPDWADSVLERSKLEAVFLTNDFDDPLEGFDTTRYVPCLRTDDLVFHLARPETLRRLNRSADIDVHDTASLRQAISRLFDRFVSAGRGPRRSRCRPTSRPSAWPRAKQAELSTKRSPRAKPPTRPADVRWRPMCFGPWPNIAPSTGCHSI